MSNYKIVFVDIDGTVQGPNKHISNNTKKVFKKLKDIGVYVVFCTGRSLGYTYELAQKSQTNSFAISSNGAEVYDIKNAKFIYHSIIPFETINDVWMISQKEKMNFYLNYDDLKANEHTYIDDFSMEFLEYKKVSQCVLTSNNFDSMFNAEKDLEKIPDIEIKNRSRCLVDPDIPKSKSFYFDISSKEVSKGNAIVSLCKYLNISLADAIAIGDGINDLSMFQTVGLSIAMGNAPEEVKKSCKLVTKDVDNDGVAYILNQIFFNK